MVTIASHFNEENMVFIPSSNKELIKKLKKLGYSHQVKSNGICETNDEVILYDSSYNSFSFVALKKRDSK